jgi:phytoene/squalene synthetase
MFEHTVEGGQSTLALAASITKAASRQTYYTIRFLVDRDRVADAYLAYAYFRWVDDRLDGDGEKAARVAFVARHQELVECCCRGGWPSDVTREEAMLVRLVQNARGSRSGLESYIRHMMAVMTFDVDRRGRFISQDELAEYTRHLATAVTEALHYFIGHDHPGPQCPARYFAVTAAHITHMLRDTSEDITAGYFNIPGEVLERYRLDPGDVGHNLYRAWVESRVRLARDYFAAGKDYLAKIANWRCRLAGYAYIARFERVLNAIECEGYRLRSAYPECKNWWTGLRMGWSVLAQVLWGHRPAYYHPQEA